MYFYILINSRLPANQNSLVRNRSRALKQFWMPPFSKTMIVWSLGLLVFVRR